MASIFRVWFLPGVITGGDLWHFFPSMLENYSIFPYAWSPLTGNGLGGNSVLFLAVNFVNAFISSFGSFLSWQILERIFILFPFLISATFLPIILFKRLFPENNFYFISPLLTTFNTYILMLVAGGLVIIGISYSLIPLVFFLFLNISNSQKNHSKKLLLTPLILGVVLGVQSLLDIRVTYMTLFSLLVFNLIIVFLEGDLKKSIKKFAIGIIFPLSIALLINSFWVLPAVLSGTNLLSQLGTAYTSLDAVRFLSFANFENSFSLLHPNWPENIFGKTYFLRPEFLLLPFLAFTSIIFIKKDNIKIITPLIVISLLGIFLAKGANEPFGQIYLFLFEKVIGFGFFRDSTKWYMLIAFTFSILIPFTLFEISKKAGRFGNAIVLLFVAYFIFLISPAVLGKLPGTLKFSQVPTEYAHFERFMTSQKSFSRTMWFPSIQRFAYFSNLHPAISASDLVKKTDISDQIDYLKAAENQEAINEMSVKYVVVPFDSQKEIYVKDRKYKDSIYIGILQEIGKVPWLKNVEGFGKLSVFENTKYKDHLWTNSPTLSLSYRRINPIEYVVNVKNAKIGDSFVFSDAFDSQWQAKEREVNDDWPNLIRSTRYKGLNSFVLRKEGDYSIDIFYYPQKIVFTGFLISIVTAITILILLLYIIKQNEKKI
jgi:hypothetical protein